MATRDERQRLINPKTGLPYEHSRSAPHPMNMTGREVMEFDKSGGLGRQTTSPSRAEFDRELGPTGNAPGPGDPAGVPRGDVTGSAYQTQREFDRGLLPSEDISQHEIDAHVRFENELADTRFPLAGGRSRADQSTTPAVAFEDQYGIYDYKGDSIDVGLANLTPAGQDEFAAAARGEIPGYSIQDPGARAAFSRARMEDPNFGRKPINEFKGQDAYDEQRRRSGGMPAGPLTDGPMNARSRGILEGRLKDVEEDIADAERDGRTPNAKDIELRDNLNRILRSRGRYGNALSDPASEGRRGRPYRMQTGHVGSARGGGALNQRRVKPGEPGYAGRGGGMVPGLTPAYGDAGGLSGTSPSGPLPKTLQQSVSPDGTTFTTSDGFSFPNVMGKGGMSEADFAAAMAENPAADDELLEYAENAGLVSDAVRERLGSLDPSRRVPGATARQAPQVAAAVARERGRLLYGLAKDASRYEERQRATSIRQAEQQASSEAREQASAQSKLRSDSARLRRIYWAYVDPETKDLLSDFGGELVPNEGVNPDQLKKIAEIFAGEQEKGGLTQDQFSQAIAWEQEQMRKLEGARSGVDTTEQQVQQPPSAPATSAEAEEARGPGYEVAYYPDGETPKSIVFDGGGYDYPVEAAGPPERRRFYLRWNQPDKAVQWAQANPEQMARVAGFFVLDAGQVVAESDMFKANLKGQYFSFDPQTNKLVRAEQPASADDRSDLLGDAF